MGELLVYPSNSFKLFSKSHRLGKPSKKTKIKSVDFFSVDFFHSRGGGEGVGYQAKSKILKKCRKKGVFGTFCVFLPVFDTF